MRITPGTILAKCQKVYTHLRALPAGLTQRFPKVFGKPRGPRGSTFRFPKIGGLGNLEKKEGAHKNLWGSLNGFCVKNPAPWEKIFCVPQRGGNIPRGKKIFRGGA